MLVTGPMAVLAAYRAALWVLTMFISNTAAAILFAPIALQAASVMSLSPLSLGKMGTVMPSLFCQPLLRPVMVMSAGKYSFMD